MIASDRTAGGVTPEELGQTEEWSWKGLVDRTGSQFLGAEVGPWTVCPSCGSAEQVMAIQLWVRMAPSPGSGPSSQMQGERRGPLSHVLSRPSFLAAAVFFPSHCQLREPYSLSRCGSHYCRLPQQTGPRGWDVVTMLNARPHVSLWLADHEPLCTALLWASGSLA